ncbi:universal stress protein [Halarchaeum acidiphilum MH1-52-1]|uniref:Universal stress protein n=2 Tax=Halarchaeum acidiphilum TaxID=489138 RepID=U2YU30_9EURY|nr:universal stress protein [Halarchaeum acidiphilum]GAD52515.1 universal stress protein [Halarchaeum acidiphilum MH1-52-1]
MYRVLVPIDDTDRAVQQVGTILDVPLHTDEVRAVLLHVFTENPEGASVSQLGSIHEARDRLEDAGIETQLAERSGTPAAEIVEAAEERDVDLIALAGRRRSPTGKAVFGSTSQRVMLDTDLPVLVRSTDD